MKATTRFARGLSRPLILSALAGPLFLGCGDSGAGTGSAPPGTPPEDEIKDSMNYMREQAKNKKGRKAAPAPNKPDPG